MNTTTPSTSVSRRPDPPHLAEKTVEAVIRYLREGGPLSISDGSGVIGLLERRLEDLLGVRHLLTFSSGTAALHCAYLALDLPPGSEVVAAVNTFHASVTPALHCGLSPVLVDVEPDTGNMSPSAMRAAITERTRCAVVTHHLGHPVELDEIADICREHGLRLIEDCSHAYLSTYRGRPVGTFGDIAVWSAHATKTLKAGEGGFFAAKTRELFERAVLAGHYRGRAGQVTGRRLRAFSETGLGLKYRMHPLAAVIALSEAALLPERVARRQELLCYLSSRLDQIQGVRAPVVREDATMGGWFSYRPSLDGIGVDEFIGAAEANGLPVRRPSVGSLDEMPLFTESVPLRHAFPTWRPRLCGPFEGARAYERGRLSLTVTAADDLDRMDAFATVFAEAISSLSGPAEASPTPKDGR